VNITFDESAHLYRIDGARVISVTQAFALAGWVDTSYFKPEHAQRGHAVHRACELWVRGMLDESTVDDRIRGYLAAFVGAWKARGWELLESEKLVGSEIHGYAGTLDLVVRYGDRRAVVDIKSGAKAPTHPYQTAAYAHAYHEQEGVVVDDRFLLYLAKTGDWRAEQQHDQDGDMDWFLTALRSAKWKLQHGLVDGPWGDEDGI
jgi:hypothetical protein